MPKVFRPQLLTSFGRVIVKEYEPQLVLPVHAHAHGVIVLVLAGRFQEEIGQQRDDRLPGWVRVLPPGCEHSNRYAPAGALCMLIEVEPSVVSGSSLVACAFDGPRLLAPVESPVKSLGALYRRWHACQTSRTSSIDRTCLSDIERLYRRVVVALTIATRPIRSSPSHWLMAARSRLADVTATRPSVAEMAMEAGVSPSYFTRAFRSAYGCSPAAFSIRARIDWATSMILTSDDSIASIALGAGFYDQSHFTLQFRRVTGITPKALRMSRGHQLAREGWSVRH